MKKKKYDTSVIMLYMLCQEHLLPKDFRKTIPYSTISGWRKQNYENYEGSQFRFLFDNNWDLIRLKHENTKLRSSLRSFAKCYLLLRSELRFVIQREKSNKDFQTKLVMGVTLLKAHTKLQLALKLLFIHRNQFYEWSVSYRHHCSHSFSCLCLKRYPRQLQKKEIEQIKRLITSPAYEKWPIVSIAAMALRKSVYRQNKVDFLLESNFHV